MRNKIEKVPAIEIKEMGGLKCDYCDWVNDNIKVDDYKDYINYLCPKCGCNVLTTKDYKSFRVMLKLIKVLNFILPKRRVDADNLTTMKCEFKGDGTMDTTIDKGGLNE